MMDILMSETCWAHKKWNKIASDIKSVFYSSTVTMMHGPISIILLAANYALEIFFALHEVKSENNKTSNRVNLSFNFKMLCNMRQFTVDYACLLVVLMQLPWQHAVLKNLHRCQLCVRKRAIWRIKLKLNYNLLLPGTKVELNCFNAK
jgi:hypothetical protein